MDSEEFMKTSAVVLTGMIMVMGCHRAEANKEKLLRKALADTNIALTEAQDRAAARQAQAERLARKLYRHNRKVAKGK